ncbi:MAG: hypothetical protein M1816_001126 [Peltula sp. TS41687]|nr:MAG: hypothetical protein M1816_001126 [Peltula sp. TS41687]
MSQSDQQGIFISRTLPDISPRSHIIGLLGTTDCDNLAAPGEDGWFLSDFYLFNYLLQGLGVSRAWFTCLEPDFLIEKYSEYAHGDPYHTRRIVLDRNQRPTDVVVDTPKGLLDAFLKYLNDECTKAYAAQEPVFILIFGHGDVETFGVEIGMSDDGTIPLLAMDSIREILGSMPGLKLSALLTSCFSGGWITHLNMTAMTAAGPKAVSDSWPASHSLGRCTGSVYTSAIIDVLQKEDTRAGHDSVSVSYRELTDQVRAKLLLLDKFGEQSDIRFSAQDDEWEQEYHRRTGIPVELYSQRLERLRTIPSTDREAHPHGDRTSDEQLLEWGLQPDGSPSSAIMTASLRGRTGGSDRALHIMMRKRAVWYLQSRPGRDSLACNHTAHNLVRKCLESKCTFDDLARLEPILDYREKCLKLADTLATVLRLKPFPPPHNWDASGWRPEAEADSHLADLIHRKVILSKLIPKPATHQGKYHNKPSLYLTAAFMEQHLSAEEVDQRLEIGQLCKGTATSGARQVASREDNERQNGFLDGIFEVMETSSALLVATEAGDDYTL